MPSPVFSTTSFTKSPLLLLAICCWSNSMLWAVTSAGGILWAGNGGGWHFDGGRWQWTHPKAIGQQQQREKAIAIRHARRSLTIAGADGVPSWDEWAALFAPSAANQHQQQQELSSPAPPTMMEDEAREALADAQAPEEEPLVFSHYNRDCFFTPVNCLVGKAGQEATNIVGSASNSRRHVLFIRRRPQ